jgi:hypothetical protein
MLKLIYPLTIWGVVKCDTLNGVGHLLLPIVKLNPTMVETMFVKIAETLVDRLNRYTLFAPADPHSTNFLN